MQWQLNYRGPRRWREKERVWENFWQDYSWKFPQHGKVNSQVQEVQTVPYRINPRRNMPRHTLIKLTNIKHKEKNLKAAKEKQQVTYKGTNIKAKPHTFMLNFQQKLCRPEGNGRIYLMHWKGKIYNQDYSTQQGSHSKLMEK